MQDEQIIDLLGYKAQLQLIGEEATALLERLVTCRVDDLSVGQTRPGALLTPQGKVIADFVLERIETGFTLHLHQDALADMAKRMKLYKLRAKIDIVPVDATTVSVGDEGTRISAGLPAFGIDYGPAEVFPTDINLDRRDGIDYRKGCFVGQEVASRMMRRGKIRKRTLHLAVSNAVKGDTIMAAETPLGTVTSATNDVALGLVRIDRLKAALDQGATMTVNGVAVSFDQNANLKHDLESLDA